VTAPLELPSGVYGRQSDVAARVRSMVAGLGEGASLADVIGPDLLDVATTPGFILLGGRSRLLEHTPAYEPLLQVELAVHQKRLPLEVMDRLFPEALAMGWGVLALVAHANQAWLYPPARHRPFWEAVLRRWSQLEGVGPRYTFGAATGNALWSVPSNVQYVAVNLGVPVDVVKRPLPPVGVAALDAVLRGQR